MGGVSTPYSTASADAYLCSYPRSGRNWVRFALAYYLRVIYEIEPPVTMMTAAAYCPSFEDQDPDQGPGAYAFRDDPRVPFVALTHVPNDGRYGDRAILLLRSPGDTLVSQFHQVTKRENVWQGSFVEFLGLGQSLAGPRVLARYLDTWPAWVRRHPSRVLTYERWTAAPADELLRLARMLSLPEDPRSAAEAAAAASFIRMAEGERSGDLKRTPSNPDAWHVRRGELGAWRNDLSADEALQLETALRRWLTRRSRAMLAAYGVPLP